MRRRTAWYGRKARRRSSSAGVRVVGAAQEGLATSAVRAEAAWDAVRGSRVGPPTAVRRWPWALGAAVLGALAAGGLSACVRRLAGQDAPGAVEPDELQAVVDRPGEAAGA